MKNLTKNLAKKCEQLKFIHSLKDYDSKLETLKSLEEKSKEDFYNSLKEDEELEKLLKDNNLFDNLYRVHLDKNNNAISNLPNEIYSQLKYVKALKVGYSVIEDKSILNLYANKLRKEIESEVEKSNNITKIAEDYLPLEFNLDNYVGELVYEEYVKGNDYYLNVSGKEICIENYQIVERDNFRINKWEEDNPLSLWTCLYAGELEYLENGLFELRLLLVDGDKYAKEEYWYLTIRGTNVKGL